MWAGDYIHKEVVSYGAQYYYAANDLQRGLTATAISWNPVMKLTNPLDAYNIPGYKNTVGYRHSTSSQPSCIIVKVALHSKYRRLEMLK